MSDAGKFSAEVSYEPVVGEPGEIRKTPGQILRSAREARGLSIEEVADVLRFSERQIEHVESDNYDALPGSTLVRGFIRGYAKFLRLDPVPLLAQLDTGVPVETTDVRPPTNIGAAGETGAREPVSSGLVIGVLVAVIVVAIGGFLFTQFDEAAIPTSPIQESVSPAMSSPATPEHMPETVSPPSGTQTVGVAAAGAAVSPAAGVAVPPAADASIGPTSPAVQGLVLEFDDLSWIEVRDATQKVVYVGEYPKGTRAVVDGKAPFALWVGRASFVRVSYKGRSVDVKSGSRDDVARITVE